MCHSIIVLSISPRHVSCCELCPVGFGSSLQWFKVFLNLSSGVPCLPAQLFGQRGAGLNVCCSNYLFIQTVTFNAVDQSGKMRYLSFKTPHGAPTWMDVHIQHSLRWGGKSTEYYAVFLQPQQQQLVTCGHSKLLPCVELFLSPISTWLYIWRLSLERLKHKWLAYKAILVHEHLKIVLWGPAGLLSSECIYQCSHGCRFCLPDTTVITAGLNAFFTFPGLYVQILKGGLFTCTSVGLVSRVLLPGQGSGILSASRFICSKWDQTSAVLSFRKATQPAVLKHRFSLFTSRKELLGKKDLQTCSSWRAHLWCP